jgi:hypothetical protein
MKKPLLTLAGAAALSLGLGIASMAPASAFSISGGSVNNITASDLNSSFDVIFNGNVKETNVSGLSATANFKLTSFDTEEKKASFLVTLTNTSSDPILGSRISAIGFNSDPNLSAASVSPGGEFDKAHLNGSFPNNFGAIEVCFTDGNNCQGGQNGGVTIGETGSFTANLTFNTPTFSSLTLNNFGVRYQSIQGTTLGDSGTGRGTPVPEPITLLGSGIALGFGMYAKRKLNGQKAKI